MKFLQVVSGLTLAIASVSAQILSKNGDFNITNPQSNYPYAAGKILPVTYDLFEETSADIKLVITLESPGTNTSYTISGDADVTKSSASAVTNNNVTVYEHTYNYNLPATLTGGNYYVVFHDNSTDTETQVPIQILAAAATTSTTVAAAATTSSGSTGTSGSAAAAATTGANVYKNGAQSLSPKTALTLAGVAALAYFF